MYILNKVVVMVIKKKDSHSITYFYSIVSEQCFDVNKIGTILDCTLFSNHPSRETVRNNTKNPFENSYFCL